MSRFLTESHRVVEFSPAILERIVVDLDAHGLAKKRLREADRRFLEAQTPDLAALHIRASQSPALEMGLLPGRPRMDAYVVYLFLMLRGLLGGCKDQQARLLLEESFTLRWWLENLGLDLPAPSTLNDNLNAVSLLTREFMHRAQMACLLHEGLDDLASLYLDSTATAANTRRPTDSGLLVHLIERICRAGGRLERFGLPNMNPAGLEQLQSQVRALHCQISFCTGKPKSQTRLKRFYHKLLRRAKRVCKRFAREVHGMAGELAAREDVLPSRREAAGEVLKLVGEDIATIGKVAEACQKRVFEDQKVPSAQKCVSLSDSSAAFILKGGWDTLVGYRPQLGRSAEGFVTALLVPKGNAADSTQLVDGVIDHWDRTQVLPKLVSTDDGYSSQEARRDLLGAGVKVVSISGSKGKKITSEADWYSPVYREARANRSAVESLIFTLKDGYEFGQLARRELDNVRAELLEKVLAYNLSQMTRIRRRHALTRLTEAARAA